MIITDILDAIFNLKINHEKLLKELKKVLDVYNRNSALQGRYVSCIKHLINNTDTELCKSLIYYLHSKQWLDKIELLYNSYSNRLLSEKNTYNLYITSNIEMDEIQLKEIQNILEEKTKLKFIPHNIVDSSIISGVIIRYQEVIINISGIFKLNTLHMKLLNSLNTI